MKIAKEAWPFLIPCLLLAVAVSFFNLSLAIPVWLLAAMAEGILVSPADGKVIRADAERITIFMNVFNIHVCRIPAQGTVEKIEHVSGKFLAAFKEEALTQNERVIVDTTGPYGTMRTVLVAGLIARRIVPWIKVGDTLKRGQKIGLIRFGSRVDLYLPTGYRPVVGVGERVHPGETVLASNQP